jgi:hypothetical protein
MVIAIAITKITKYDKIKDLINYNDFSIANNQLTTSFQKN